MIQSLIWDDEGNHTLIFDQEGIDYMMTGLMQLSEMREGARLGTPTVWSKSPPWWRFWDRSRDPKVGEFFLKRVDEPLFEPMKMEDVKDGPSWGVLIALFAVGFLAAVVLLTVP
jgi:hypothetical protein